MKTPTQYTHAGRVRAERERRRRWNRAAKTVKRQPGAKPKRRRKSRAEPAPEFHTFAEFLEVYGPRARAAAFTLADVEAILAALDTHGARP